MTTNLPSCFFIQFLEQLLKFLVNFTLLKYVKSQRSYGFLITKELIFGFQILDLKDHFSASLNCPSHEGNELVEFGYSSQKMCLTSKSFHVQNRSFRTKLTFIISISAISKQRNFITFRNFLDVSMKKNSSNLPDWLIVGKFCQNMSKG